MAEQEQYGFECEWCGALNRRPSATSTMEQRLIEAVTGDEEPGLWRVEWAQGTCIELWKHYDPEQDEDPDATREGATITQEMFRLLSEALAPLREAASARSTREHPTVEEEASDAL